MADFTPSECALAHPSLYSALQIIASTHQPTRYLEIGVREGDSLHVVVEAARDSLRKLVLCDTWEFAGDGSGRGNHNHIACLLGAWNYTREVQWVDGDSHQLLKPAIQGQVFDLILIDGDHSEVGAHQDLLECYESLAPGGLLLFDDVFHHAHPYLLEVIHRFVHEHPDLRLACEVRDAVSGLSVVQRW